MAESENIFPLRLSGFESYAFCDDTPKHPMVIVLSTAFEGALREDVLRNAIARTLQKNPLLTAVVDDSGWQLKWRQVEQHDPAIKTIHFDSEYPPVECAQRYLNLTEAPGVEFEIRLCATRGTLVTYFHHACVDGLGAIQFIGDVFAEYGQETTSEGHERPEIRAIDKGVLRRRGTKRPREHQKRAPVLHTLTETFRLFYHRSYRLVGRSSDAVSMNRETEPNILHSRNLSRAVLKRLKRTAYTKGVTLNDLCMMVFLQQIDRLSSSDAKAKSCDLFRILMPVSMRSPDHDAISAANVVSYVFHNFRREDVRSSDSLLQAIHKRSQQMLHRNEAVAMLYGFALTRLIPGMFRLSQRLQPDYASAALTSVGEVRRILGNRFPMSRGRAVAGDVVIQRIDGVAPVRENTNLTLAVGTYGGELILHLNRNTKVFTAAEAEAFLDSLTAQLNSIAEAGCTRAVDKLEDNSDGVIEDDGVEIDKGKKPEGPVVSAISQTDRAAV